MLFDLSKVDKLAWKFTHNSACLNFKPACLRMALHFSLKTFANFALWIQWAFRKLRVPYLNGATISLGWIHILGLCWITTECMQASLKTIIWLCSTIWWKGRRVRMVQPTPNITNHKHNHENTENVAVFPVICLCWIVTNCLCPWSRQGSRTQSMDSVCDFFQRGRLQVLCVKKAQLVFCTESCAHPSCILRCLWPLVVFLDLWIGMFHGMFPWCDESIVMAPSHSSRISTSAARPPDPKGSIPSTDLLSFADLLIWSAKGEGDRATGEASKHTEKICGVDVSYVRWRAQLWNIEHEEMLENTSCMVARLVSNLSQLHIEDDRYII